LIDAIKDILDHDADDTTKRHFLIPNLPDLSKTPYGIAHAALNLSAKSREHNKQLKQKLETEILKQPQYANRVVIFQVDMFAAFEDVLSNKAKYNFTNLTDACYSGSYMPDKEGTQCGKENEYMFWDDIHLTAAAHCIVTKTALQVLAPKSAAAFKCELPASSL